MRTAPIRALALAALTVVALSAAAGCGSSSGTSAATTAAAGAGSATTTADGSTLATVKATGGGSFCTWVADSLNQAKLDPTSKPADLKKYFDKALSSLHNAVSKAPGDIKADLKLLESALEQEIAALAKVDFDFSKVGASTFTDLDTPAFKAASARVDTYVKKHCGLDLTGTSTP